jgi:hypothetical protein
MEADIMTATTPEMIRFDSMDDCLGPRHQRFFGEGFKRVSHRLTDITIDGGPDGPAAARAHGRLTYPTDWSRKATRRDLRPHLSSIDALLLGVQAAEASLASRYGLTAAQSRRAWLRGFAMRAGSVPQEDLDAFTVAATPVSLRRDPFSLCGWVTTFDCTVGTVRLRCEIEHEVEPEPGAGGATSASTGDRTVDDLLGDPARRYYGNGYIFRQHDIREVVVDPLGRAATAQVAVAVGSEERRVDTGIGAAYQPTLTMIDCTAVLAQIAQVLIYQQDGVARGGTDTLWMRRLTMSSRTPWRPLTNPFVASVEIDRTELLQFGGGIWRTTRFVGEFQGIQAQASLAHRLPSA